MQKAQKKFVIALILMLTISNSVLLTHSGKAESKTQSLSPLSAVTFTATELLGRPTNTSITVNVVPSANGQVFFKYGVLSGVYSAQTNTSTLTSGIPTNVVMQGLNPDTRYYYRMATSSDGINWVDGDEHSFQTQRSLGSTFTFTLTSDSHVNWTTQHQTG